MVGFLKVFSKKTNDYTVDRVRRAFAPKGSVTVTTDSAMQVSAFYRAVTYVSTQIAKLPWDVKNDKNEIIVNSISNLLNLAPNPEMNAFTFRLLAVQNAMIHGNFYAEIERNGAGTPIALWPLPSTSVEPIRDSKSGTLYYRVYGGSISSPGEDTFLAPRDVFHIKNFHTKDGIVGQGVVAYATETLGITLAADQMAAGLFNNGGIPSGVITYTGELSPEALKRLKDSWDKTTTGRKVGGTKLLEEGMKYEPVAVDAQILQFIESRQFGVEEISRFTGCPPTKLFYTKAATFSNVENANLEVATDTLDSWAVTFEMEADVKILSNRFGGRYSEIDIREIFRGDSKSRSDYFKTMVGIGAMTPNQIRAREGMPGYGEVGDNYYIATNNFTPVDRMDEVIDAQIAGKKSPAPAPVKEEDPDEKELKAAALSFLKK